MPELTDDDIAKTVVTGDGEQIGIVDAVKDGTAYVDPDRDMASQLKSNLGWSADTKDTYPLRNDAIADVTDDEIRLQADYTADSVS